MATTVKFAKCGSTHLAHIATEKAHGIALGLLSVLLYKDNDGWFAQGLEIDHFACGKSEEDVKKNFAKSLGWTISSHIRESGSLDGILKAAPQDVRRDFLKRAPTMTARYSDMYRVTVGPKTLEEQKKAISNLPTILFFKSESEKTPALTGKVK